MKYERNWWNQISGIGLTIFFPFDTDLKFLFVSSSSFSTMLILHKSKQKESGTSQSIIYCLIRSI
jgi:hypothetical protein